jgi:hypothetical protein
VCAVLVFGLSAGGCGWLFDRSPADRPDDLPPAGQGPPNAVELTVYFVSYPGPEAPARFRRYWDDADESVLPPDRRALWQANGLRLGVVGRAAVDAVRALQQSGRCDRRRLRVLHGGRAILSMSPPVPLGTFLLTLPDRRAAVHSFPNAAVALAAICRVVSDQTTYLELVPQVLQPGRDPEDTGLLEFLTTELALDPGRAVLVGMGSRFGHTAGRFLMATRGRQHVVERLLVIHARPVHVSAGRPGAGEQREGPPVLTAR